MARLSSFFHHFRPNNAEATENSQPSTPSRLHRRLLFAHLSSLIHHSSPKNDAPDELQQSSTPSRLDLHELLVHLSSLFPCSRLNTVEKTATHPTLVKNSNSRNAQGILMLSKWLQYETGRHCVLLRGRDLVHALSLMVLQHLHHHNSSYGGLMSYFFFAVCLLSPPMAM